MLTILVTPSRCTQGRAKINFKSWHETFRIVVTFSTICLCVLLRSSAADWRNVVPESRQIGFQKRELEVLIHFGINTFTGREWGGGFEKPEIFIPSSVNARQWIETAKSAGAKAVVLVCKHHDGFCLWPSEFTEFSVKSSPWKQGGGDVVKEISDMCHEMKMEFGIYVSPSDLHEYSHGRNSQKYNDYFCNQLRELLTNYGEICEVFFDGAEASDRKQSYDWPRYYRIIRELQPKAVITVKGPDVRWVGNEQGVARESEWSVIPIPVPAAQYDWPDLTALDLGGKEKVAAAQYLHWYPALADVSIRPSWFWRPNSERSVKTVSELIRLYELSVGRNAVFQLGVAPNREGVIPDLETNRLKEFGDEIRMRFATNLVLSAKVSTSQPASIGENAFTQKIALAKPSFVKYIVLQEQIEMGQYVERFAIIVKAQSKEPRTFKATTIGYKRFIKIDLRDVTDIEVQVLESRAKPRVSIAVY